MPIAFKIHDNQIKSSCDQLLNHVIHLMTLQLLGVSN